MTGWIGRWACSGRVRRKIIQVLHTSLKAAFSLPTVARGSLEPSTARAGSGGRVVPGVPDDRARREPYLSGTQTRRIGPLVDQCQPRVSRASVLAKAHGLGNATA